MNLKKKLGLPGAIKEEEMLKADSSGNEEDRDDLKRWILDGSDSESGEIKSDKASEQDLGPLANVSLLDQHNVLKKKAEGMTFFS